MRVDGGDREQRWDWCVGCVGTAVGQDHDCGAAPDELRGLAADQVERAGEPGFAFGQGVEGGNCGGPEALAA